MGRRTFNRLSGPQKLALRLYLRRLGLHPSGLLYVSPWPLACTVLRCRPRAISQPGRLLKRFVRRAGFTPVVSLRLPLLALDLESIEHAAACGATRGRGSYPFMLLDVPGLAADAASALGLEWLGATGHVESPLNLPFPARRRTRKKKPLLAVEHQQGLMVNAFGV